MVSSQKDIRWIQRFQNFQKAFAQLTRFMHKTQLNELEEQGLIQAFEYNHELAWKTLKDILTEQGIQNILGSKDVTRESFRLGLLGDTEQDGLIWMSMIESRNLTSHTYNEATLRKILLATTESYFPAFQKLENRLSDLAIKEGA